MIVYIHLEHDQLRQYPEHWEASLARTLKHKYRFEELSGEPCLIMRYHRANPAKLRELKARAAVVSGCTSDFEHYSEAELAGLRAIFCEAAQPLIGLCGGHQLLAQAYGAPIAAMGGLAPGSTVSGANPFPNSSFAAGARHERGFQSIRVSASHPLLAGLGDQPVIFQSHYWEVKSAPARFQVLAESELCPIQILAHESRPLFGVQFHPEAYDEAHPAGRQLLANFFRLAGIKVTVT